MTKTEYTLKENVIIKHQMPRVGIICSNPRRAERIAHNCLENATLLTYYQSAWAIDIYIGTYKNKHVFVAGVAVGASGASFSVQQLAAAGAKVIIRYGSNDNPGILKDDMHNIILVDSADNLYGLMQGNGAPKSDWGTTLYANTDLINTLNTAFQNSGIGVNKAICHHVEDYVAYTFPSLHPHCEQIQFDLKKLESQSTEKLHCRDMESAALFYRARIDGFAAATVLQNVPKPAGTDQVYNKEIGELAKQIEPQIAEIILDVITPHSEDYKNNFMTYTKLDEHNIKEYLKYINNKSYVGANITEIGDGNLNQVFRVTIDNSSLIIKQALPYLRCVGESYELDKIRMKYEIAYLKIASELYGKHVPELYHTDDKQMMLMHMQDLSQHQLMREGLINGIQYPNFSKHIAKFLANVLFKTSRNHLDLEEHAGLIKKFNDNKLKSLTEDFFFTFAFIDHETNYKNSPDKFSYQFRKNVKSLLDLFATNTESLSHGDLHTGSIFVNQSDTYIIDGEFAFMGPIGFDLGLLIANLMTAYIRHKAYDINSKSHDMQDWLIKTIQEVINNFFNEYKILWDEFNKNNRLFNKTEFKHYQNEYFMYVLQTSIGFAGVEMCRRTCGLAGVKEIREIPEPTLKEKAEDMVLDTGMFMVENYQQISSIQDIILKL